MIESNNKFERHLIKKAREKRRTKEEDKENNIKEKDDNIKKISYGKGVEVIMIMEEKGEYYTYDNKELRRMKKEGENNSDQNILVACEEK